MPAGELPALLAGGAELKTNPDHQRLLERAAECMQEGRPDLAAVLWQKVLDEAADALTPSKLVEPIGPSSSPLVIYMPLTELVERTIVEQPRAALAAYRTTADAEARAILAAAPLHDERALAEVARRFFLSSVGDDAAFSLANMALDRHDFVSAYGLLDKVVNRHPDYSMAKGEVLVRIAVAAAHVNDGAAAERAMSELKALPSERPAEETLELIAAEVKSVGSRGASAAASAAAGWPTAFGNPGRSGHMTPLPTSATESTLAELWSQEFPLATLAPSAGSTAPSGYLALDPFDRTGDSQARRAAAAQSRSDMTARWRAGSWRPAGGLLFADEVVYFKAPDRMVCFDAAKLQERPVWQSGWQNRYELDATARYLTLIQMRLADTASQKGARRPASMAEILLFADRVHQSMTLWDGVLFSLEGKRLTTAVRPEQRPFSLNTAPRRARSNWLTAYQAAGGRAIWTRSAADEAGGEAGDVGFLAAPTPCGDHFVVPVTEGGGLWLYGLAKDSGTTLWKTHLCDEPPGGAVPWAAPVLAIEGCEAYLAAGTGLVFAVDGTSGAIRWAVRYPRSVTTSAAVREMLGVEAMHIAEYRGWDDDVVIPQGRLLLVMASDGDRILALDRRTGERVWEAPRTSPLGSEADYCLGVVNESLYVAGKNVVRQYEVSTGRLLAEQTLGDSYGRGCLTADALYLPVNTSLLKLGFDLRPTHRAVNVVLSVDEPVGNLFSDGRRLWGVGAGRFYALTTLEERLATLDTSVARGDVDAQLERMRLYLKAGRGDEALADLRDAFVRLQAERSADEAAQRLLAALVEHQLPKQQPGVVLRLIRELFINSASPVRVSSAIQPRLAEVVATCVNSIRQEKPTGAVRDLLAAAALMTEEYLQTAASFAVDALAGPSDVAAILQALGRGPAEAQLISIRAAARLAPTEAKPQFLKLLQTDDDRVRLSAARALANLGERRGVLETLVSLLGAENLMVRTRACQTLQALTGERIPFSPEGPPTDRNAAMTAWRRWVQATGAGARLNLPLADRTVRLGRTLIVTPSALIELDAEKKERWRMRLPGAAWGCQGLPNGHRLVAINSHSAVIEYDDGGKEVWKKDRLPAPPTSVQRLENGNTLVACPNAKAIVEIWPDGKTTILEVPGSPTWAERLDSGNTLVAVEQPIQRVIELDSGGRIIWEARTAGHPPAHATRLENGNTLVTLSQARQVAEYDPTGETIVWRTQMPFLFPVAAQRLASGNTLIADQTGVREIDAAGKEVKWQLRVMQAMGLSAF